MEEDDIYNREEKDEVKECIYVFRQGANAGEKCPNKLSKNQYDHGSDRYCSKCRSKDPVKYMLELELDKQCQQYGCSNYVLKTKQVPRCIGDEDYCKICLANEVIREGLIREHEEKTGQTYIREPTFREESFVAADKFTAADVRLLYEFVRIKFETEKLEYYVTQHSTYIINVILARHTDNLAKMLMWATNVKEKYRNKRWHAMRETTLLGELFELHLDIVKELLEYLQQVNVPAIKMNIVQSIKSSLIEASQKLPDGILTPFNAEIQKIRDLNHTFVKFISERINVTDDKKDFVFTDSLFNSFSKWILTQENKDEILESKWAKSCISFGIELKKHLTNTSAWTVKKYGSKTAHLGVKIKYN